MTNSNLEAIPYTASSQTSSLSTPIEDVNLPLLQSAQTDNITSNEIADNTITYNNLSTSLVNWIESQGNKPSNSVSVNLQSALSIDTVALLHALGLDAIDLNALVGAVGHLGDLTDTLQTGLDSVNNLLSQVSGQTLSNGSVITQYLADNAVTTAKVAAGAITNQLLGLNSVNSSNIVNGTISTADIANGAINGSLIATGAITSDLLADGSVITSSIANGAVTSALLASNSVGAAQLAADAVTSAKIADGAIATADIASGAITNALIAANAVGSNQLANNAVLASKLSTAANKRVVTTQVGNIAATLLSTLEWPAFVAPSNGTITKVTFTNGANVSIGGNLGTLSLVKKSSNTTVSLVNLANTALTAFTPESSALGGGTSFNAGDVYTFKYDPGILGVSLTGFLVSVEYVPSE